MAAIALLGLSAQRAAAWTPQFVLKACNETIQQGFWEIQYDVYEVHVNCPDVTLNASAPYGGSGEKVLTKFPVPFYGDSSLSFTAASAQVAGSYGTEDPDDPAVLAHRRGMRFCSPTECGAVFPHGENRHGYGPYSFPSQGDIIPVGANRVELIDACDLPTDSEQCAWQSEMTFSDISLRYEDSARPSLTIPARPATYLQSYEWISKVKPIDFVATDRGSGVARVQFSAEPSGKYWNANGPCAPSVEPFYTRFCPQTDYGPEYIPLDSDASEPRLVEGRNTLTITAVDLARNSSDPYSITFYKDTKPPLAPKNLRAVDAPHGWTNKRTVDLAWDPIVDVTGYIRSTSIRAGVEAPNVADFDPGEFKGLALPAQRMTEVGVRGTDRAGNVGVESTIMIGHDDFVLSPPEIKPAGLVGRASLANGNAFQWSAPADASSAISGICGYGLAVDDNPEADAPEQPTVGAGVLAVSPPAAVGDGRHFLHVRAISCSGEAGRTAHIPVTYDLTPPSTEIEPSSSDWLNEGDAITVRGFDDQTSVRAIHYRVDLGDEFTEEGDQLSLVLNEGVHDVRYQAEDAAGNRSVTRSVVVRVDGSPPIAWVEPQDPTRPTIVRGVAVDSRSGLEYAQLLYRSAAGTGDWIPFGEAQGPGAGDVRAVSLAARFPDLEVPDGEYEIAVRVRDRVGRQSVAAVGVAGSPPVLHVPMRGQPQISLGIVLGRRKLPGATVGFGHTAKIAGTIRGADGRPLTNERVRIAARTDWSNARQPVTELLPNRSGQFRFVTRPGPSRQFYARFDGSETLEPAEASVAVATRSRARFAVSPLRVRGGDAMRFDMSVVTRGATLGADGKLANIQFRDRAGVWRNFTTPGLFRLKQSATGRKVARWRHVEAAPILTSARRIPFRLHVPREGRWPYADGWSKPVYVEILPLSRR